MFTILSYPLEKETPVYPTLPSFDIRAIRSISAGDSKTVHALNLTTHTGTHVDFPSHVTPEGEAFWQGQRYFFNYKRVCLLDIPKDEDELIMEADLAPYAQKICTAELVLVRTGFNRWRGAKHGKYVYRNPGFSVEAVCCLAQFTQDLKAVGIDSVSIGAYQHRKASHRVHELFLNPKTAVFKHPILIVEDMNLAPLTSEIESVIIIPILTGQGLDGSPCIVLGMQRELSDSIGPVKSSWLSVQNRLGQW